MFRELIEEKWETVLELCKEAEVQAMKSPLRGWTVDVIIDKSGDVWLDGPRSAGTQSESEWNGDSLCIYSAKCGEFDLDYMLDCVEWPDSMVDFVEEHRIKADAKEAEDIAACVLWVNGECMFFDEDLPQEVIPDFIENYADALDYESKIFVE